MSDSGRPRPRERAAGGFLIALMVIGSPVLWIGVPIASSWAAAQLTADATTHLQIVVPLTISTAVGANIIVGERYREVTDQSIQYALGHWGKEAPLVMDREVKGKILNRARAEQFLSAVRPLPTGERATTAVSRPGRLTSMP